MAFEKLYEWFGDDKDIRPNKFTLYIGDAIRKAREELGISQEELAKKIYKRRATLSDIEHGKSEPDAGTLAILAHSLKKPLSYFYPRYLYQDIKQEDLDPLEFELLKHFEQIYGDDLKKAAINQIRALSEFDPVRTLWNVVDITVSEKEREAQMTEYMEKLRKRPKSNK
jgi:transcriptional regulator with XRE-family HTH domain